MFSRNGSADRSSITDIKPIDQRTGSGLPPPTTPSSLPPGFPATSASAAMAGAGLGTGAAPTMRSIIGNDLTIVGQGLKIITKGTLQVDGKIEGDVIGTEVIIGERGHVTGIVSAESVTVRGQVQGTIKAMMVSLQSGAHVEGDVHHRQLSVEQGAHLDGRVRRPQDDGELKPDLGDA